MGEVSYAPLSAACVRALTDKMYDKRKAAALEIEKWVEIPIQSTLRFNLTFIKTFLTTSPEDQRVVVTLMLVGLKELFFHFLLGRIS